MVEWLFDPYVWGIIAFAFLILELMVGTELVFPPLSLASVLMVIPLNLFGFPTIEIILYTFSGLTVVSVAPFWYYKKYKEAEDPTDLNKY